MVVIFFGEYKGGSDNLVRQCLKKYCGLMRGVKRRDCSLNSARLAAIEALSDADIVISRSGKPRFENVPVEFSLTHSRGVYAAAFSERAVGLDIECERRPPSRAFAQLEAKNKCDFFLRWTRLEAFAKYTGEGLGFFLGGKEQIARRVKILEKTGVDAKNLPIMPAFAAAVACEPQEIIMVKN